METERNRQMKKELRTGFTTGTCAAACTRAAVLFLHRGSTCGGRDSDTFRRPGDSADCPGRAEEDSAVCGVQKDSGDDPDVTNGTLVCARAVLACHDSITESGYTEPAYPN